MDVDLIWILHRHNASPTPPHHCTGAPAHRRRTRMKMCPPAAVPKSIRPRFPSVSVCHVTRVYLFTSLTSNPQAAPPLLDQICLSYLVPSYGFFVSFLFPSSRTELARRWTIEVDRHSAFGCCSITALQDVPFDASTQFHHRPLVHKRTTTPTYS